MTITVHLFARAKDLLGADSVRLDLPSNATVGDLRRDLAEQYPSLAELLKRSALAVDNDFAKDEVRLTADCEVALIPPVSGGAGNSKARP